MIKRYSMDRDYANNIGVPGIVEMPGGEYVRLADHQAELALVEAMAATQTVTIAELRAKADATLIDEGTKSRSIDTSFSHACDAYMSNKPACGVQNAKYETQQRGTNIYVEARECVECNHIGINDSDDKKAACNTCDWAGDNPGEDICPGCSRAGTMSSACPECGGRYRLLADAHISAQPGPAMAPQDWIDRMAHMMIDLCMDNDAAAEIMAHARKRVQPASGEDTKGSMQWVEHNDIRDIPDAILTDAGLALKQSQASGEDA
ncbi:hypothetical protein H0A66_02910 [Alcaligenaceae bacterium]|nr:hypothetical protein [Alcaligenaceae bacterium]